MKHLFILSLTALFIACTHQQSKDEIAKEKIKEYVKKNINDPSSYENIEYSPLGEMKGRADRDQESKYVMDSLNLDMEIAQTGTMTDEQGARMMEIRKRGQEIAKMPVIVYGYQMTDKCRAKNALGVPVVHTIMYSFDTLLNITAVFQDGKLENLLKK